MADANSITETPYGVIYCVENIDSGMVYIGQTVKTIQFRWRQHCYYAGDSRVFGNAIKKHGKAAFIIFEIDVAYSKKQLDALEVFYISLFDSTNRAKGYNLDFGGGSGRHSDETKKFMSELKMGHDVSAETRAKISKSQIGRVPTEETRRKLSAVKIGVKHTPERIAKVVAALTGKKATEEAKKSLSEARKRLWRDPKTRENMRQSSIAARSDPLYIDRVSQNSKDQWSDESKRIALLEARAKTQEAGNVARKAAWADPIKKAARVAKIRATLAAKKAAQI